MKNKNAFLIFVFALLLYGLFSDIIPLVDPDEPVYGETAKEMLHPKYRLHHYRQSDHNSSLLL